MTTIRFSIHGTIPSKKNKFRVLTNPKTGKPFILSKKYDSWHKIQMPLLPEIPTIECCTLSIQFAPGDRRSFDLTNKAESVLDLLVAAKILKDDNYNVVQSVKLSILPVQKNEPVAYVEIETI